jgi:hypothetical protein
MPAKNEPIFSLGWATGYARSYTSSSALSRKIAKSFLIFIFELGTREWKVPSKSPTGP